MPKKSYVNLQHARTQEQIDVMKKIEHDGVCPFCMENFLKYHPKPIIHENESWIVTENMSPYDGSIYHFLFVHKSHCTMPNELPEKSHGQFFALVNWIITKYKIIGGSVIIRFGDTNFTGATVDHFHAHVVVGETRDNGRDKEGIKTRIGYKKKS